LEWPYFTLKFLNYEGQQFSKYIPDLQQSVQLQFIVSLLISRFQTSVSLTNEQEQITSH